MKKSLIALAALAAVGVASAQSSVSIYGIVDMSYGALTSKTSAGVQSKTNGISAQQSMSRIGFTGVEDLGGGLRANFTLEYYIEPDNGSGIGAGTTGASSARQAFAGISGGFGSLNIGNQTTLVALTNGTSDFHGGTNSFGYSAGQNQNSRRSNMIQYTTPTISGFSAAVQLGYNGVVTPTTANGSGDNTAIRLTYAAGPITAAYAHETTRLTSLAITSIGATQTADFANAARTTALSDALADRKRTAYGATYNFGVARAGFTRTEGKAGSAADTGRFETTSFGVSIPLGALTLNATADNGEFVDSGGSANKIGARQLSAYYALSKRTNLYAISGELKNKTSTAKDSHYAVGLRHQF